MAGRADLSERAVNEFGGWGGQRISEGDRYYHGRLKKQLHEAQEKVGDRLQEEGYLDEW